MKCPYHPNEDTHPVKIPLEAGGAIDALTCPECEWSPPTPLPETGRTCPEIDTMGWPTDL